MFLMQIFLTFPESQKTHRADSMKKMNDQSCRTDNIFQKSADDNNFTEDCLCIDFKYYIDWVLKTVSSFFPTL
jgi:hypothetical protein